MAEEFEIRIKKVSEYNKGHLARNRRPILHAAREASFNTKGDQQREKSMIKPSNESDAVVPERIRDA